MTPADHQKAGILFEQLCGLPDAEITAALDAACAGNVELRDQVLLLLEADRAVSDRSFLEARAIDDVARALAADGEKLPGPGTVIANYRLGSRIGAGGMGVVYEAQDLRLQRRVAVKILPPPFAGEGVELVNRFQRESRAASLLNHPNILTIFDAGFDQGHYYIATEFVEGKTLRRLTSQG
jgi:serine/threonine protein kinase